MHQIRRFDDLGRIAIPKEMREAVIHAKNTEGVQMDVDVVDGAIVLKPHKPKDMVEVVHGEWKQMEFWPNGGTWRCSECGRQIMFLEGTPITEEMNYCPNCGAKMDGEVKKDDTNYV